LRFVPPDDEGFILRGDKQRLVYKGRRRSHRFTILGDAAFEYDCILEKEPASNIITLFMEGAERFDFFRQPDCIKNPLLAGSYAVYKKETFIGEGTGKLCHIHRPEIIDAQGRRCWGDLFITGNRLCVVIPEPWLAAAAYPVIVDPIIGLSSLGALGAENFWGTDPDSEEEEEEYGPSMILGQNMGVNQFAAPHAIAGNCTAWLYVDYYPGSYHWSLTEYKMWPVLYAHDPAHDRPGIIKSSDGGYVSNDVGRTAGPPRGWRSADIAVDGTIQQGQQFWFGFFFWRAHPRYDYGGRLYESHAGPYQDSYAGLRQKFYQYPIETETGTYTDAQGNTIEYETWAEPSYELKISMYLEYTVTATNYTRTLIQGATLTDSRKLAGAYKRTAAQTAKGTTALQRFEGLCRQCVMSVYNGMALQRAPVFVRKAAEQVKAAMGIGNARAVNRAVPDQAAAQSNMSRKGDSKRNIGNTAAPGALLQRYAGMNKTLFATGNAQDGLFRLSAFPWHIVETVRSADGLRAIRELLRRITAQAGTAGTAKPEIGFRRDIASSAKASTTTARHSVFLRTTLNALAAGEYSNYSVVWLRRLPEQGAALDRNRHIGGYLRGLYAAAGSMAETSHAGEYHRKQADMASSQAVSLRHLCIFLRLATLSLVRDYIIGRFLKSKEELIIKSPVCREIILESRL
jgi:hypothetical protein